jgi:hypothetical protein
MPSASARDAPLSASARASVRRGSDVGADEECGDDCGPASDGGAAAEDGGCPQRYGVEQQQRM